MFNYEWQKYIKQKYLNMAHAMQIPYNGDKQGIANDIKAANEMIEAYTKVRHLLNAEDLYNSYQRNKENFTKYTYSKTILNHNLLQYLLNLFFLLF